MPGAAGGARHTKKKKAAGPAPHAAGVRWLAEVLSTPGPRDASQDVWLRLCPLGSCSEQHHRLLDRAGCGRANARIAGRSGGDRTVGRRWRPRHTSQCITRPRPPSRYLIHVPLPAVARPATNHQLSPLCVVQTPIPRLGAGLLGYFSPRADNWTWRPPRFPPVPTRPSVSALYRSRTPTSAVASSKIQTCLTHSWLSCSYPLYVLAVAPAPTAFACTEHPALRVDRPCIHADFPS